MTGMGALLSAVEKKSCRNNIFFPETLRSASYHIK